MEVRPYKAAFEHQWNQFNATAFNGHFLFDRRYMDYHAERFSDKSLLIFDNDILIGLLPACVTEEQIISHGGLTFGGIILGKAISQRSCIRYLAAIIDYYRNEGARQMRYKAMPALYWPKQYFNVEFALSYLNFKLVRRDASTSIFMAQRGKLSKGRKAAISKAKKHNIQLSESTDFERFFAMQNANIGKKYGASSVHSADEMRLLQSRFPANIKLTLATTEGQLLAGAICYHNRHVKHLQYFAMNAAGEHISATDLIIDHLVDTAASADQTIFDFGISTERDGSYLNEGLSRYKESFGGVTTLYDTYELTL